MCIYVDDMIYLGSSEILVAEFKLCMEKEFETIDLGKLRYFLGLRRSKVKMAFLCLKENIPEIYISGLGCITARLQPLP